jgi:hypothetical protein
MSAKASDQERLDLEDILAMLVRVDDHCRVALLKLSQWARTDEEGDILAEVFQARKATAEAKQQLAQYHRNYAENGRSR